MHQIFSWGERRQYLTVEGTKPLRPLQCQLTTRSFGSHFDRPTSLASFIMSIPYATMSMVLTMLLLDVLVRATGYNLGGPDIQMQRIKNTLFPFVQRLQKIQIYLIEHIMVCRDGLGAQVLMPELPLCTPEFAIRSKERCDIQSYAFMTCKRKNTIYRLVHGTWYVISKCKNLHLPSHHLPFAIRIYRRPFHEQIVNGFQSSQCDNFYGVVPRKKFISIA